MALLLLRHALSIGDSDGGDSDGGDSDDASTFFAVSRVFFCLWQYINNYCMSYLTNF